jgi:sRNA-binding carbon storage regulator CsrA
LGFSAPAEMNIYRKEIFEAILAANKEAADQSNVSLDALCGMFGQ